MALYPDVPFASGQQVSADQFYLAFHQVFDDQTQYLGHQAKIADTSLSDSPTALKARFTGIENAFSVSQVSGLVVSVTGGTFIVSGTRTVIPTTQVTLPNNATSFIYIDASGTIQVSTIAPPIRFILAQATTSSGAITTLNDYRYPGIRHAAPATYLVRMFGGQSTIDKVCVQGEVLKGTYEFRNFTVPAGVTITIDRSAKLICSGNVDIYGSVNVNQLSPGSPRVILGLPYGIVPPGAYYGNGLGYLGNTYHYTQQGYGSSGGSGVAKNSSSVANTSSIAYIGNGGDGGGVLWIEAAGVITYYNSAVVTNRGGNAQASTSFDGAQYNEAIINGSNGGSGGLVYNASATSIIYQTGCVIDVRGGNAGDGYIYQKAGVVVPYYAMGGNPGGGGYLVSQAPLVNSNAFTFLNAGGSFGANASVNSAISLDGQNRPRVQNLTYGLAPAINGAAFAGVGGVTTYTVGGGYTTYILVPAGNGIHYSSNTFPNN